MELWDLYTENRIKTGETHIRGHKLPKDRYHLVVHVWIKNSEGKYLISKRSKTRIRDPLKFETVGGAVLKGENSLQAAIRETQEEVGINLNPSNGRLIYSELRTNINGIEFNDIKDVWLFEYNGDIDLKSATTDEVAEIKWMSIEEINNLYKNGLLVNTLSYCFKKIFIL